MQLYIKYIAWQVPAHARHRVPMTETSRLMVCGLNPEILKAKLGGGCDIALLKALALLSNPIMI